MQEREVLEIVLQKQRSRRYNGTNYYRYRVTIPVQIAEQLGWKRGAILDVSVVQGRIVIKRLGK